MEIKVGILGLGTVGRGVLQLLTQNQRKISMITGNQIRLTTGLVRNIEKHRVDGKAIRLVTDFNKILNDNEIQYVIETIGGIHPAKEYITQLLEHKKNVVTANKDLIANYGPILEEIALANNVSLRYEASVAGGIPILNILSHDFIGDEISEVTGIVNGTTNYILSQMNDRKISFQVALKQAQELGYAEADPTNDVSGKDAAYKMLILTRFSFGTNLALNDIKFSGITKVDSDDLSLADELGYKIKLLGIARKVDQDYIYVSVAPTLVKKSKTLAQTVNEDNAIEIKSFALGKSCYSGPGAGSLATANSVVNDLIAELKSSSNPETFNQYHHPLRIANQKQVFDSFYIRLSSLNAIKRQDFDNLIKKLNFACQKIVEIDDHQMVIMTEEMSHQQLQDILDEFKNNCMKIQVVYRIQK